MSYNPLSIIVIATYLSSLFLPVYSHAGNNNESSEINPKERFGPPIRSDENDLKLGQIDLNQGGQHVCYYKPSEVAFRRKHTGTGEEMSIKNVVTAATLDLTWSAGQSHLS